MTGWNLPPGCTDADIDRASGGYDECLHEEYEIGYDGRARCDSCGEAWWPTEDEIRSQRERIAAYDAYVRREERLDRYWRPLWRIWYRVVAFVYRPFVKRQQPPADEIPF